MPAFSHAERLGYRLIEIDVHSTRDDIPVVAHDPRVELDGLERMIENRYLSDVQRVDLGAAWSPDGGETFPYRGQGLTVPTLEAVLTELPDVRFILEPKSDASVGSAAEVLDRLGAWDRVCVGSFRHRRLRRMRALSGGKACTSMGLPAIAIARAATVFGRLPRFGADCLQLPVRHGSIPVITPWFVDAAHKSGLPVHAWTINDGHQMHDLLDIGVDGIITDTPSLLKEVLAERGEYL